MRVGLIGMGSAGTRGHLPVLTRLQRQGLLTLVATADRRDRSPRGNAGKPAVFRDGARLLDSVDLDLVVIAAEPGSHAALVELAGHHGRHVVCEKPLALSVEDHHRIASAVPASLALLAVHQYRYSPPWLSVARWARRAVRLRLPVCVCVDIHRCGTDPHATTAWRADTANSGGVLADHGPHFLALAWTIAHDLQPVSATRHAHPDGTETIHAALRSRGAPVTLRLTTTAVARRTQLQLRTAGVTFTWTDHEIAVGLAGRTASRRPSVALSDRRHVDELYDPLYRDLLRNISNGSWRQERRIEALAVSHALVQLLASATAFGQ
jgi:predicted dehydrogenase